MGKESRLKGGRHDAVSLTNATKTPRTVWLSHHEEPNRRARRAIKTWNRGTTKLLKAVYHLHLRPPGTEQYFRDLVQFSRDVE